MSLDDPHTDSYDRGKALSYGGFPAMINALNAALEVFESEDEAT